MSLSELILDTPDITFKKFLSLATKVIREECICSQLERLKDKEDTSAGRDLARSEDHQDTLEQEDRLDNPRELTIDESGETAQIFHKVLLFYWCMIHDIKDITPVLTVLNSSNK